MNDKLKNCEPPMRIWSFAAPALPGGLYTISVNQELGLADAAIDGLEQTLYIDAPRFALDPLDIHSLYPARDAVGNFAAELPFIVFTKPTLPWERIVSAGAHAPETKQPPVPWLALLVFAQGEVSETYTATILDYLHPAPGGPPIKVPLAGRITPEAAQFIDQQQQCQYIEVDSKILRALLPRLNELPYLAHVRRVEMKFKPDMDMPSQGVFAIVMANRLPLPGRSHIAHLVSVEGCEDLLVDRPDQSAVDGKSVRIISLASWKFECSARSASFRDMIARLPANNSEDLRLALPVGPQMSAGVQQRLKRGYVPLPYHLMSGARTFAWYRGPAVPAPSQGEVMPPPAQALFSASAAMQFDRSTGVFDQTYAAAWQLGRSLALADPQFGPRLMGLRRKAHRIWDEFCDLLFFAKSGELTVDIAKLAPAVRKLIAGQVDLPAVDAFLDSAFDHLAGQIAATTEKMTGGRTDTLPIGDLLQMTFDPDRADAIWNDTRAGLFDLISKVVESVLVPLKETLGDAFLADLGKQLDLLSGIYKLALVKLIDRTADMVLKPRLARELEAAYQWFDNLSLADIPFYYLVAHPGLLPAESLRFFYIDEHWWYALFDGAASLGIHSSIDEALYQVMRQRYLRRWIQNTFSKKRHRWGLILRSGLVGIWSGIEFYVSAENTRVDPVITRKLDDDLILFLFDHMPDSLELREPREGLRFAVDAVGYPGSAEAGKSDGNTSGEARVAQKHASDRSRAGKPTGQEISLAFRKNGSKWPNVLDIAQAARKHSIAGSAEFALQLIKKPRRLILKVPNHNDG